MGIAFGSAIAAQALYPKKKVCMVLGDSSFGFSCMEIETAARHKMPLKVVIINNNGISFGTDQIYGENAKEIPVHVLSPDAKYEMIATAFGGIGRSVDTAEELDASMKEMLSDDRLWVLNVHIDPYSMKKEQSFKWLSSEEDVQGGDTKAKL